MITRFIILLLCFTAFLDTSRADLPLDFKEWGLLAVQEGGRRKPMDTMARENMVRLTGQKEITAFGKTWEPCDFVLSVLLDTHDWKNEHILLISFHPLVKTLGLDESRTQFAFNELAPIAELNTLVKEAHDVRAQGADVKPDRLHQEAENVAERLALFNQVEKGDLFLLIPAPKDVKQAWVVPPNFTTYYTQDQVATAITALQAAGEAYKSGDNFNFTLQSHQLRLALRALAPDVYPTETELQVEYFYNGLHPFDFAPLFYGIAFFFLGCGAWFSLTSRWPSYVGFICIAIGLLYHLSGMALRCWIGGRPPVTNMYESMIWVASGVLIFGIVFFIRYRTVLYLLAALPISISLLLLVGQMPLILPENIDPLVPVLRNNYWLVVHVLTITLSYAAFALAMGFGHILLFDYLRNPSQTVRDKIMHFWLYRVIQLGVLLLATGTILGGVWANYSWGRFWGWDPKETWALITLLCYLVVLHGKLAGWWGDFGLAFGSVVCFLAVVMAWYGVNFVLGSGMHTYGSGFGGESYVMTVVFVDLLFVGAATCRYLRSGEQVTTTAEGPAVVELRGNESGI